MDTLTTTAALPDIISRGTHPCVCPCLCICECDEACESPCMCTESHVVINTKNLQTIAKRGSLCVCETSQVSRDEACQAEAQEDWTCDPVLHGLMSGDIMYSSKLDSLAGRLSPQTLHWLTSKISLAGFHESFTSSAAEQLLHLLSFSRVPGIQHATILIIERLSRDRACFDLLVHLGLANDILLYLALNCRVTDDEKLFHERDNSNIKEEFRNNSSEGHDSCTALLLRVSIRLIVFGNKEFQFSQLFCNMCMEFLLNCLTNGDNEIVSTALHFCYLLVGQGMEARVVQAGIVGIAVGVLSDSQTSCVVRKEAANLLVIISKTVEGWSSLIADNGEALKKALMTSMVSFDCCSVRYSLSVLLSNMLMESVLKTKVSGVIRTAYVINILTPRLLASAILNGLLWSSRNISPVEHLLKLTNYMCTLPFKASLILMRTQNRAAGEAMAIELGQCGGLDVLLSVLKTATNKKAPMLVPENIHLLLNAVSTIRDANSRRRSSQRDSDALIPYGLSAYGRSLDLDVPNQYKLEAINRIKELLRISPKEILPLTEDISPSLCPLLESEQSKLRECTCNLVRMLAFGHSDASRLLFLCGIARGLVYVLERVDMTKKFELADTKSTYILDALHVTRQVCNNVPAACEEFLENGMMECLTQLSSRFVDNKEIYDACISAKKAMQSLSSSNSKPGWKRCQRLLKSGKLVTGGTEMPKRPMRRTMSGKLPPACAEAPDKVTRLRASLKRLEDLEKPTHVD
eukprot:m.40539 g.40539  ORF g.40539 m.40539 type:complete len:748 (-) comp9674_c0_seq4:76-2319(-)